MIDLDELDRMLDAGDRFGHATSPAVVRELIAEVRTLRARLEIDPRHSVDGIDARDATICQQDIEIARLCAALNTPQSTRCELGSGGWSADGAHHDAAETAFMIYPGAIVTVYYGEKRIYADMAAFCAAHPKEGA